MKIKSKQLGEAFLWTGDENQTEDPEWIISLIKSGYVGFNNSGTPDVEMYINRIDSGIPLTVKPNNYIVNYNGEVYPMSLNSFNNYYEIVE